MSELAYSNFLKENNAKQLWHPMAHPNDMEANPPAIISHGDGVYVRDIDGNRLLDGVGGLWNVNLGYSCQAIKDAIMRQLDDLPYYSAFRGTTTPGAIELSYKLTEMLKPENMRRAFFTSGGSDSVETALRLARQYWKVQGQYDRTKFISLRQGYHGTHFGGASVNGNNRFRRNYEPLLAGCFHLPTPWLYRNPFNEDDPEKLAQLCAQALEEEIKFQSPDTVAAFIAEPVQGAGGVIVPPASYWPLVREICDRYDVLLISDEVITGFGRIGYQFGTRAWGVAPDMMCIAKAITSGYFPFGAVLANDKMDQAFKNNHDEFGSIGHGYTYSAHPVGCAAALATLEIMEAMDLAANAANQGEYLKQRLEQLQQQVPMIGDVRGKGLMLAIEFVADPDTKTPADKALVQQIADKAYQQGVMIRVQGHSVILSPPLILEREHCDAIADAIAVGCEAISH